MAGRDDIYTALRNADAAGDTASAQKLAAYLKTMPADGPSAHDKAQADTAAWQASVNPTNDMSGPERIVAGVGRGMASIGRAVGLGRLLPDGTGDTEEAKRLDAPLLATRGGKFGNAAGVATTLAPSMMIPGVNTYAGAAALGAGTGLLATEGGIGDRINAGLGGAVAGPLGQAAGNLIGKGVEAMRVNSATKLATEQGANAVKDATLAGAQDAGYVVTPSMSGKPNLVGSISEGIGGKIKTQQAASVANQPVTNALAKKALGLPEDEAITADALKGLRTKAGAVYQAVAGSGTVTPTPAYDAALDKIVAPYKTAAAGFPNGGQNPIVDTIEGLRSKQFDAGSAVAKIGELRDQAGSAYAKGDDATGRALKKAAGALEDQLESHLQANGSPDALKAFRSARADIAKSYDVQKALNNATGDVSALKLAAAKGRGRPLSGELSDIADFAGAFPKAAQSGVDVPRYSIFDFASAAHAGGPAGIALPIVRPAARALALSKPVQRGLLPTYQVNPLLKGGAAALTDPRVQALEGALGAGVGANWIGAYGRQ